MSANNENEHPNGQRSSMGSNTSNNSRTNSPVKSATNQSASNQAATNQLRQQLHTVIPMSRVKTIMKSSPDIVNINPDTLYIVCKATVKSKFDPF